MSLQLPGRWVWDFWLVQEGSLWHVFFLHAPQTPRDPDRRHFSAAIGHAVSIDLISWQLAEDALTPGPAGSWDDMATWTGSAVAHPDGGWAMLYTGVSSSEQGLVQRIGIARSDDLQTWVKHPENPVLEADARWYELLDTRMWHDQAWRDPWLVEDPAGGLFHAFITARAGSGDPQCRGVIGYATSVDLVNWDVGPPIVAPDGFGHMEVPQVFVAGEYWHLLFSAPASAQVLRSHPSCTGTFHAISDELTGPYREVGPLFCDRNESLYGGKIVVTDKGRACLAFRYLDRAGDIVGELTDPMPVELATDGSLILLESHPY